MLANFKKRNLTSKTNDKNFLNKVSKGDLNSLAHLALTIFACFGGVFYGTDHVHCTSELQLKVN